MKAETTGRAGHAAIGVKALRAAMKDLLSVVERRNTIPVLSGVLLAVGPSTMTLTATDLDLQLVRQLDLDGAGTGRAMTLVVDAATLSAICGKLDANAVMTLDEVGERGGRRVDVKCGRTRFSLPTLPADDFPVMPGGGLPVQFEMDKATLQQLLHAVAFAMSDDEARYYLRGIYMHFDARPDGEADALTVAATDGHRLAVMSTEAPEGAQCMSELHRSGVIIGRKTVGVIDKMLDAEEGATVSLGLSDGKLVLEFGQATLTAKLIDGQFPDYTRVIPAFHKSSAWVDPKALAATVDRLRTVCAEKTHALSLEFSRDVLRASAHSPERGSAEEELEVNLDGDALTIGFNGGYLAQVLPHLTASPALIRMSGPAGPALLMDSEDARRRFVLMPMRV